MTDYKVTVLTDKWDRFRFAHRTGGTIEIGGKVVEWYLGEFESGVSEKPLYIDGKKAPVVEYEGQGQLVNSEDEFTRQASAIFDPLVNRHHPEHCGCDDCELAAVHDDGVHDTDASAYHEAGHALLVRLLGYNVDIATINGNVDGDPSLRSDTSGFVEYHGDKDEPEELFPHKQALITRGGGLGVSYGYYNGGEARFEDGSYGPDKKKGLKRDEECTCKPTLTERVVAHNAEAEKLIKTHKQELVNLAKALLERGTLRGNEVIDAARNGEALEPRNEQEVRDLENWEHTLETGRTVTNV